MKRVGRSALSLLIGCSAPLLIWLAAGSALYYKRKQLGLLEKAPMSTLICSRDADCPSGFVCASGHCVPAK